MNQEELLHFVKGLGVGDDLVKVDVSPFAGPGRLALLADVDALQKEDARFLNDLVLGDELDRRIP